MTMTTRPMEMLFRRPSLSPTKEVATAPGNIRLPQVNKNAVCQMQVIFKTYLQRCRLQANDCATRRVEGFVEWRSIDLERDASSVL